MRPKSNTDLMWLRRIVADGGEVGPMSHGKGWGHRDHWRLSDGTIIPDRVVDRLFEQEFIEASREGHGIGQGFKVDEAVLRAVEEGTQ